MSDKQKRNAEPPPPPPEMGDESICRLCGKKILWNHIGRYWQHADSDPRHIADPDHDFAKVALMPMVRRLRKFRCRRGHEIEESNEQTIPQILCFENGVCPVCFSKWLKTHIPPIEEVK